jgi:hypothetical protein
LAITGQSAPASGQHVEIQASASNGFVYAFNRTSSAALPLSIQHAGGNVLIGGTTDITGSGGLKVFGTTASTSTTTGALQVAGGVGVAGALFAGGVGNFAGGLTAGSLSYSNSATGFVYGVLKVGGSATQGAGAVVLGDDQSSQQNVGVWRSTSNGSTSSNGNTLNLGGYAGITFTTGSAQLGSQITALTLDTSQNATFAGTVTTKAPTGGAGAWELGVANTVTPTAPDRTITIEIGGTVYYLHAKTTND